MKNFENELTKVVGKDGFTRLVKPFRSDLDSSVEPKAQSDSQSSQTKYRNCVAHSYGFTLAETLITVAILGVVAAITIPAIINHQTESANRTKLKKAMTTYEKALNQMIIENDLKTNDAIVAFGADGENCANTTEYFKKVEGDGCRFKTADRIWWDISDIENPLVMLKDKYSEEEIAALKELAKKEDDREVFGMIGRLDDSIGVLRINDKGAETETPNKEYMTKLYNFMNKVENAAGGGGDNDADDESGADEDYCGAYCQASKITTECTSNDWSKTKNCYVISKSTNTGGGNNVDYYDENQNHVMSKSDCKNGTENCYGITFCATLKDGYRTSNFTFANCINGVIADCMGFCGSIYDDKNGSIYYANYGNYYKCRKGNDEIPCPLTVDEIKALF